MESVHCCSVQVLSLRREGGRCLTIQTLKIAVHSAKSSSTATTIALTSIKQKIKKGEVFHMDRLHFGVEMKFNLPVTGAYTLILRNQGFNSPAQRIM